MGDAGNKSRGSRRAATGAGLRLAGRKRTRSEAGAAAGGTGAENEADGAISGSESEDDELAVLQRDAELPLEELKALYGGAGGELAGDG